MPPSFNPMIETYSSTVTEIAELGGTENSTSSSTVVCDRCGFAFSKKDLTKQGNLKVCSFCIDDEQEKK